MFIANKASYQEDSHLTMKYVNFIRFAHGMHLEQHYPEFASWFHNKITHGVISGERSVIFEERNGIIVGFTILKHTSKEKKICTLRVTEDYQNKGLGVKLFDKSFDLLETEKPLLSVSETMLPDFNKMFNYFGFKEEQEYKGIYIPNVYEISYNGELIPD